MKTNMTANLVLSLTLGVALAFAAAVGAIVLLPSDHSVAMSLYDLVSATQPDLETEPAVVSPAAATTFPPTDTSASEANPDVVTAFVATSSAPDQAPITTIDSPTSTPVAEAASTVEQSASDPVNLIAVGQAVLAQVTRSGGPDVGSFVAAALPLLLGQ